MTISQVQKTIQLANGTGTVSAPGTWTPSTAGTTLVACLTSLTGGTPFSGPAGWTQRKAIANGTAVRAEIWTYENNPGGIASGSITFTSGTAQVNGEISEWASSAGTVVLDTSGSATAAAATTCPVTASAANAAGDLGIAAFGEAFSPAPGGTFATPSGWAALGVQSGTVLPSGFYRQLSVPAGTLSVTGTYSTATGSLGWASCLITLKEQASGITGTPASAGVTLVQKDSQNAASGGTVSTTLPSGSAKGNLLVACLASAAGGTAFTGLGTGWQQARAVADGTTVRAELWYYQNNPGGITSITVTSGTGEVNAEISEYSAGPNTTLVLDQAGSATQGAASATAALTAGGANAASGELAVACFADMFSAAAAGTSWVLPSSWSNLANLNNASHPLAFQAISQLSAATGTTSVTGTYSTATGSLGWAAVLATFTAVVQAPMGGGGLVGENCPPAAYGASDQQTAIANWEAATGRQFTCWRQFYSAGNIPASLAASGMAFAAAAGIKVVLSLKPATNGADTAALDTFLKSCSDGGLLADVTLYHEAAAEGLSQATYQAVVAAYGPVIRRYYRYFYCQASSSFASGQYLSYFVPGAFDGVAVDFYGQGYLSGQRLDTMTNLADAHGLPCGIFEFGISEGSAAQVAGAPQYYAYLQSVFGSRLAAGKPNADLCHFTTTDGTAGTLAGPSFFAGDFQVALYDALYDAVGIPAAGGSPAPVTMACQITVTTSVAITLTAASAPPPDSSSGITIPGWPQLYVEAGFIPVSPVAPAGALILDDPLTVLDSGRLGGATNWTDISAYVRNFTIARQYTREQGPLLTYQSATLTVTLDNSDARFDPDNTLGPYVIDGTSAIRPMIAIRIRAVLNGAEYGLFSGFAGAWQDEDVTYSAGYDEVTLSADDGFKILSGQNLVPADPAQGDGELSGARINRILDAAGWYTDHRRVAAGNTAVQATSLGADPLSLLQLTADTEIGELYIDGAGNVVFRNRHAILTDARSAVSQGTFGDLPDGVSEVPYAVVSRANDDTILANDVQITRAGGTLQEATDAASVALNLFPRTYSRTDVLLESDAEAMQYAQWVLHVAKCGENRFETLTIDPLADLANLFPQVLARDIGDRITCVRRPPGMPEIVKDSFVRGITHTVDCTMPAWQTQWGLQDATPYSAFLILDDTTAGLLDSSVLAY